MSELVAFVLEQLPKAFGARISIRSAQRCATNTTSARRNCSHLETRARERGFAVQSAPTGQVISSR